ncbi:hypothetical protein [Kitasatospora sp. NPDC058218]|uniref:hypothetical protein n=1 Tax=Kitasatospora sp. NPDC058218 TaxID=3346385 RepID=UPI0036D96F4F
MYSYDVSAAHRRSTAAPRVIPGMRPSYDAEHPHSATPIYDELYSEYRRLFRALPGDRSGEENLKFAGFAVRDGYPVLAEPRPYPPQHQAFQTYAGQAVGIPQFMPSQQGGAGHTGAGHAGAGHTGHHTAHAGHPTGTHPTGAHQTGTHSASTHSTGTHGTHHGPADPTSDGLGHAGPAAQPAQPAAQFTNGQGWVAAGYLGPVPHPMPAPAPAPVMGSGAGSTAGPATGGRHRNLLSLPPGRSSDQR